MRCTITLNMRRTRDAWEEGKHKRDHGKFAKMQGNQGKERSPQAKAGAPKPKGAAPKTEELEHAKALGLPTSYSGTDSRDRFAGHAVDNPLPQAKGLRYKDLLGRQPAATHKEVEVPIDSLRSAQDYVMPSAVARHLDMLHNPQNYMTPFLPRVVQHKGELVLLDGNHKTVAARLAGHKTIRVLVEQ